MRAPLGVLLVAFSSFWQACDSTGPRLLDARVVSDTDFEAGPYEVLAIAHDPARVARARLFYQGVGLAEQVDMTLLPGPASEPSIRLVGQIAGQPFGTTVRWGIELCDSRGNCSVAPPAFPEDAFSFVIGTRPSNPKISSVLPSAGPESGGTQVEVRGDDFRRGLRVRFGDVEAPHVEWLRSDLVLVSTPAHPPGLVDVSVENPDGVVGTLADAFTFLVSPKLYVVAPPSGPQRGGTEVTLNGANFDEEVTVWFDGVVCRHLERPSGNELRCVTPPGRAGLVDVEVRHPRLGSAVLPEAFTYVPAPIIDRVSPDAGSDLGGSLIEISGANFDEDAEVWIGDRLCVDIEVVDEQTIRCTVPPGEPGVVDVTVHNADGQTAVFPGGFNYLGPPVVLAVLPDEGPHSGGNTIRVLGAGFMEGMLVLIGDREAEVIEVNDGLEIEITVPPASVPLVPAPENGVLRVDVSVVSTTPGDGRSDTLPAAYSYYWPPEVLSVEPSEGPTAGGTEVAVVGRFFREIDGESFVVRFGDASAIRIDVETPSLVRVLTPPGEPGFVDVTIQNHPDSVGVLRDGYLYIPPPEIDRVTPAEGPTFGGERITLDGRNFRLGAQVFVGDLPCLDVEFISETQLQCTTPPGNVGFVDVMVINPDGQSATRDDGYRYVPVAVTPDSGLPVGFTRVEIRAAGIQPGALVRFGSALLTDCVVESATKLICQSPPGAPGPVDVRFINPDGTGDVAPAGFTYRRFIDRTAGRLPGTNQNSNHVESVDVDLDGDLDLVVANGTPSSPEPDQLFLNDGEGRFERTGLPTPLETSNKISVGDLDGDALPDLVVAVSGFESGGAVLLRNQGDGAFSEVPNPATSDGAFDAQLVDLVGDARDDLMILAIGCSDLEPGQECDPSVVGRDSLFERVGSNLVDFTDRSSWVPHDVGLLHDHKFVAEDIDGDGARDLVLLVDNQNFFAGDNRHRILWNRTASGAGFVEDRTPFAGLVGDIFGIDAGDIDGDGDIDVVAPSCLPSGGSSSELVFLNQEGTLVQVFARLPVTRRDCDVGVHLSDLDRDGDLDLLFVGMTESFDFQLKAYVNRGDGTFVDATPHVPNPAATNLQGTGIASGDFDGDGDVDLAVASVSPFQMGIGDLRIHFFE